MIIEIMVVVLLAISLIGFAKVYLDWSGFERKTRRSNLIDPKETKSTAIRIIISSAIAGLAMGLAIAVVRLASPQSVTQEKISAIWYIAYTAVCAIGWPLFALVLFGLKVLSLGSIYKKKDME